MRDRHARQRHDPHHQAHHVAGHAAQDVRLGGELQADRHDVVDVELEMADGVGAGLEQQLRGGVEQHAGEDEGETDGVHGFPHDDAAGVAGRPRCIGSPCARNLPVGVGRHQRPGVGRGAPGLLEAGQVGDELLRFLLMPKPSSSL